MNHSAIESSPYVPSFPSTGSALRTLRKGKSNPNWRAAAEYLIERAAPDVKLLLEADRALQHSAVSGRTIIASHRAPWSIKPWLLGALAVLVGSAGSALAVWVLASSLLGACESL